MRKNQKVSPFDTLLTAEQVLGIHRILGIPQSRMSIEMIGLPYKNGRVYGLSDWLRNKDISRDKHVKAARKEAIRVAKFHYRFDDNIHKPTPFAQAYLDGTFDKIPEEVICSMRSMFLAVNSPDINFKNFTKLGTNDFKFGNPTEHHIQVIRVCSDPITYTVMVYLNGLPKDTMDVRPNNGSTKQWYT